MLWTNCDQDKNFLLTSKFISGSIFQLVTSLKFRIKRIKKEITSNVCYLWIGLPHPLGQSSLSSAHSCIHQSITTAGKLITDNEISASGPINGHLHQTTSISSIAHSLILTFHNILINITL